MCQLLRILFLSLFSIVREIGSQAEARGARERRTWTPVGEVWFWWLVAAVLAQRPDLKTSARIDRKLPSYALRHVRRARLSGLRGRPAEVQEDEYCAVKLEPRLFGRRFSGMVKVSGVERRPASKVSASHTLQRLLPLTPPSSSVTLYFLNYR